MSVRIKISYEKDHERERILTQLRPILSKAQIKNPKQQAGSARYKTVYIQLGDAVSNDP